MKRTKITKELEQSVIELYKTGISTKKCAVQYNINQKTVRSILGRYAIDVRGAKKCLLAEKFTNLLVTKEHGLDNNNKVIWECLCDCGNIKYVRGSDLLRGKTKSCGCIKTSEDVLIRRRKTKNATNYNVIKSGSKLWGKGYGEISGGEFGRILKNAYSRQLQFTISIEYIWDLFLKQDRKCALSGLPIHFPSRFSDTRNKTASLDRIDSSKGYIEGNVQWVHKNINVMKLDFKEDVFIDYCERIMKNANVKQGVLFKTRTYLGGNLEYVLDEYKWREQVTEALNNIGIICLDPTQKCFVDFPNETLKDRILLKEKRAAGDETYIKKYMSDIIAKDLRSIDISDFIIFKLEVDKPTFGTIHEFVVAEKQHKPLLIIVEDRTLVPLWLRGLLQDEWIFTSIEDCIEYICKINNGEIKLNTKYWKLLEPAYR